MQKKVQITLSFIQFLVLLFVTNRALAQTLDLGLGHYRNGRYQPGSVTRDHLNDAQTYTRLYSSKREIHLRPGPYIDSFEYFLDLETDNSVEAQDAIIDGENFVRKIVLTSPKIGVIKFKKSLNEPTDKAQSNIEISLLNLFYHSTSNNPIALSINAAAIELIHAKFAQKIKEVDESHFYYCVESNLNTLYGINRRSFTISHIGNDGAIINLRVGACAGWRNKHVQVNLTGSFSFYMRGHTQAKQQDNPILTYYKSSLELEVRARKWPSSKARASTIINVSADQAFVDTGLFTIDQAVKQLNLGVKLYY